MTATSRSWIEVELDAIAFNAKTLLSHASAPALCAVVKANGYGHGATLAARGALRGGATILAVAQVAEGIKLRRDGIDAPIWVLGEPTPEEFDQVIAHDLEPTLYTDAGVQSAQEATARHGCELTVHVNADTGMHRSGRPCSEVESFLTHLASLNALSVASLWTHLAVADEPGHPYSKVQLTRFAQLIETLDAAGLTPPLQHAANSGATVGIADAHYGIVRPGLALYGVEPSPEMSGMIELRPALRLVSKVALTRRLAAGDRVGYGQVGGVDRATTVATIPIGYADGVRRESGLGRVDVLIRGQRCPIVGRVSMDQIVVDCGDLPVAIGDEVVLIGQQGEETITVEELASKLNTISNEVLCDLGSRLDRIERPQITS